jgi:hypothetical protein
VIKIIVNKQDATIYYCHFNGEICFFREKNDTDNPKYAKYKRHRIIKYKQIAVLRIGQVKHVDYAKYENIEDTCEENAHNGIYQSAVLPSWRLRKGYLSSESGHKPFSGILGLGWCADFRG